MCIITATAVASALGISLGASAAGVAGVGTAGVLAGIANTVLAVGAIGSTVAGIASGVYQGNAAQAQANYQKQVAEQNAKIAQKEATEERQAGIEAARTERIKALAAQGQQKTAFAANGMEIAEGSALDTIEDTAMIGELNALNTQYNHEQRAINYEQQAYNFENEANLQQLKGENARTAGTLNAISSASKGLSGIAGTVSDTWGGGFGSTRNNGFSTSGSAGTAPKNAKGYKGTLPQF